MLEKIEIYKIMNKDKDGFNIHSYHHLCSDKRDREMERVGGGGGGGGGHVPIIQAAGERAGNGVK